MAHRTTKGSWTRLQIEALGIDWPPKKGWIDRVVGNDLSERCQWEFQSKLTAKQVRKIPGIVSREVQRITALMPEWNWESKKEAAIATHEANEQLDRELIAKQRELL